eukprot:gene16454-22674_t
MVNEGKLVPDDVVIELLNKRLQSCSSSGSAGYILDGFPRTQHQAEKLLKICDIQLALNLSLREEVLVEKCLGRRNCTHCGKGYNIADIHLVASEGRPEIILPPLSPPPECADHLEIRADDVEAVVRQRLEAYQAQATPVEEHFKQAGLLQDFEITSGIPETLPHLKALLEPFVSKLLLQRAHEDLEGEGRGGPRREPTRIRTSPFEPENSGSNITNGVRTYSNRSNWGHASWHVSTVTDTSSSFKSIIETLHSSF